MSALFCRIELNKKDGVVITVDNKASRTKQQILIQSDSIKTTSESASGTSTITQDPNEISFNCKRFIVNADTIECKANKSAKLKSGLNCDLEAGANLSFSSKGKVDIKSGIINATGKGLVKIEGAMIKLQ
ncbi:hypothetical protein [Microbulbifer variabilis]|uniref:hypothetical protein n=1 Tax=Microbulbifer variabilis TaxID=266805 RepID=UPI001CFEC3D1|nr:hypothetical protein [Microbulbifer variabilis]